MALLLLVAWHGRPEKLGFGQKALYHRAKRHGAASTGTYTETMEILNQAALSAPRSAQTGMMTEE